MRTRQTWLDRRLYPGVEDNWDDALFRRRILSHLSADARVLDLGAGAGIVLHMNFRGAAKQVCGVDLDPRVLDNPFLDEAKVATGEAIPYPDGCFDLVFADNVAEHLAEPERVFGEVRRVLRPGGRFLFKTPNRKHYVPWIARTTPTSFHRFVNGIRGRQGEDTFPTLYRANSRKQVQSLAERSGFTVESIELIEGRPEYLRMLAPAYLAGALYERLVNSTEALRDFRVLLIATLIRD